MIASTPIVNINANLITVKKYLMRRLFWKTAKINKPIRNESDRLFQFYNGLA